jgi:hypothetical protein
MWFGDDVYEAKRQMLEYFFMPSDGVDALMEPVQVGPPVEAPALHPLPSPTVNAHMRAGTPATPQHSCTHSSPRTRPSSHAVRAGMMCAQTAMQSARLSIGLHIRTGTKHTSAVQMATRSDVDAFHKCVRYWISTHFGTFDAAPLSKVPSPSPAAPYRGARVGRPCR